MKSKKFILASTFLLAMALLTGCAEKDKDRPEETSVKIVEENQKEIVKEELESSDKKEVEPIDNGFTLMGDDKNGYFKLPKYFVPYKEVGAEGSPMTQFANPDETFIVSYLAIDKEITYKDAIKSLRDTMSMDGPDIVESKVTVAGLTGRELHQDFKDFEEGYEDFKLHVYILQGETANRYIAIEYNGEQEALKNKILESYSEKKE